MEDLESMFSESEDDLKLTEKTKEKEDSTRPSSVIHPDGGEPLADEDSFDIECSSLNLDLLFQSKNEADFLPKEPWDEENEGIEELIRADSPTHGQIYPVYDPPPVTCGNNNWLQHQTNPILVAPPMLISNEKQRIKYGSTSTSVKCGNCQTLVTTKLRKNYNASGWIFAWVLCVIFLLMGIGYILKRSYGEREIGQWEFPIRLATPEEMRGHKWNPLVLACVVGLVVTSIMYIGGSIMVFSADGTQRIIADPSQSIWIGIGVINLVLAGFLVILLWKPSRILYIISILFNLVVLILSGICESLFALNILRETQSSLKSKSPVELHRDFPFVATVFKSLLMNGAMTSTLVLAMTGIVASLGVLIWIDVLNKDRFKRTSSKAVHGGIGLALLAIAGILLVGYLTWPELVAMSWSSIDQILQSQLMSVLTLCLTAIATLAFMYKPNIFKQFILALLATISLVLCIVALTFSAGVYQRNAWDANSVANCDHIKTRLPNQFCIYFANSTYDREETFAPLCIPREKLCDGVIDLQIQSDDTYFGSCLEDGTYLDYSKWSIVAPDEAYCGAYWKPTAYIVLSLLSLAMLLNAALICFNFRGFLTTLAWILSFCFPVEMFPQKSAFVLVPESHSD
eukprot:maker-scaffold531_size145796-snap-gene-0.22 protein:Tk12610 transcript:maker-scaffold531_size145796-snap-gene-0.22-mRNA-1 annotation:"Mlp"